jgi:protoporphyrinogen oxidase
MAKVAVVGAGAMGLAAAYHALKAGHAVSVFEADRVAGGMAAHFDFDGVSLERFYHFICMPDRPLFELLGELGIEDKLVWRKTSMGYYVDGRHYDWGDPIALLKFPKLSWLAKLRYGLHMFLASKRNDWVALDKISATEWFLQWQGREAYDVLWRRLFGLKFFEFADRISAAWIWNRIKRVAASRTSLMQEQLGYIDGGSEVVIEALVRAIGKRGGTVRLGAAVGEITSETGRVTGLIVDGERLAFDAVISTVPTPYVSKLVPSLPAGARVKYDAIPNIACVCVALKLAKPVSRHFWINVNDPAIDIPGMVEFSNLRSLPDPVVYIPYYMPQTHPKFTRPSEEFVAEAFGYLRKINPALGPNDLKASHVGRLRHAQPICEPGFLERLPKIQTAIAGLQIADTCFYYPEDRGMSESVRYGKLLARAIDDPSVWAAEGR